MTKKVKKEKGLDPLTGEPQFEVIHLNKQHAAIYEMLEEILVAIKK